MERKIPLKLTMLKQELLNELREIVKEDFGKSLNDKELFEFGNNLLSYFELLAKIHMRSSLEDKIPQTQKLSNQEEKYFNNINVI
jgi:hypothetical protein